MDLVEQGNEQVVRIGSGVPEFIGRVSACPGAQIEITIVTHGADMNTLQQFFGCCFHQDWVVDHSTWDHAVQCYIARTGTDFCEQVAAELRVMLDSGQDLAGMIDAHGGNVVPSLLGFSEAELLSRIAEMLERGDA